MLERGASQSTMDLFYPKGVVEILEETTSFYLVRRKHWGFMKHTQWLPKDGIIIKFQEVKP